MRILHNSGFLLSLLVLFCLINVSEIKATHIKAADLSAKINPDKLSSLNSHRIVRFTLTLYCDKSMVESSSSTTSLGCEDRLANCATLDFADGDALQVPYTKTENIGNNTLKFTYVFDHQFPIDRFFTVGYRDENRVAGIINLGGSVSNQEAFYISIGIQIEPSCNQNQSPILSLAPVDFAGLGRKFIHNAGAYDSNGDSISYKLDKPKSSRDLDINSYTNPSINAGGNTQDGTNRAKFFLDSTNGDIIWDAPGKVGLFTIAYIIEEWRIINGQKKKISAIQRDMLIEVVSTSNKQPIIAPLQNARLALGQSLSFDIEVSDPDQNAVNLELYGELFNVADFTLKSATLRLEAAAIVKTLTWTPRCENVRKAPYQVFLKSTDLKTSPPLVDIKSFFIHLNLLQPSGLKAENNIKGVLLSWNSYDCLNDLKFEIFRKSVCTSTSNYDLIGEVPIDAISFVDSSVKNGIEYSYTILVKKEDKLGQLVSSQSLPTCINVEPTGLNNGIVSKSNSSVISFPNPFTSKATIKYNLPTAGIVKVEVFDMLGKKIVEEMISNEASEEKYYVLDGTDLLSGNYFYRFSNNSTSVRGIISKK